MPQRRHDGAGIVVDQAEHEDVDRAREGGEVAHAHHRAGGEQRRQHGAQVGQATQPQGLRRRARGQQQGGQQRRRECDGRDLDVEQQADRQGAVDVLRQRRIGARRRIGRQQVGAAGALRQHRHQPRRQQDQEGTLEVDEPGLPGVRGTEALHLRHERNAGRCRKAAATGRARRRDGGYGVHSQGSSEPCGDAGRNLQEGQRESMKVCIELVARCPDHQPVRRSERTACPPAPAICRAYSGVSRLAVVAACCTSQRVTISASGVLRRALRTSQ